MREHLGQCINSQAKRDVEGWLRVDRTTFKSLAPLEESGMPAASPTCCARCPHVDQFHANCSHPFRQLLMRELESTEGRCPLYEEIRASEMRSLARRLGP